MYDSKLPKQYTLLDSVKGSAKTGTGAFVVFELLDMVADKVQGLIALFAKIVWKLIRNYTASRFSKKVVHPGTTNGVCLPAVQSTCKTSAGFNLAVAFGAEQIKKQRAVQKN